MVRKGGFAQILVRLAAEVSDPPYGHKPAVKKGRRGRLIGRTKGGNNAKLHAVMESVGRPVRLFIIAPDR